MKFRIVFSLALSLCLVATAVLVVPAVDGTAEQSQIASSQKPQFQRAFSLTTSFGAHEMEFSGDGQRFFVLTRRLAPDLNQYRITEGGFEVWDITSRRKLWSWRGQNAPLLDFAAHPNGKLIALASVAGVWIRDVSSGKNVARLPHAQCVAFSKDGRFFATVGDNSVAKASPTRVVLKLWSVKNWRLQKTRTIKLSKGSNELASDFLVTAVGFSPDGSRLMATTLPGILIDCTLASSQAPRFRYAPGSFERFAPDGRSAISREVIIVLGDGNDPSTLALVDLKTLRHLNSPKYALNEKATTAGELISANAIAYTPDSRSIAAVFGDGFLGIFSTQTGKLETTISPAGTSYFSYPLAFSPDGKQLVSGTRGKSVQFWEKS